MKKLILLLAALSIIISNALSLISCSPYDLPDFGMSTDDPEKDDKTPVASVVTPGFKDYERGSVDFSELEYERPDIERVASEISEVARFIKENRLDFDSLVNKIRDIEDDYETVRSMSTLAEIYNMKDTSNEYWARECEYTKTSFPEFREAVENMLVACARSEHKERFENEYFFYSLDEYLDGGMYTDAVVELMKKEAELENKYSSLSPANVNITYLGKSGTAESIISWLSKRYPENSRIYQLAYSECMDLYHKKMIVMSEDIYTDLIKTRKLIANELGYDSYTEYAYKTLGYDYSREDMLNFLSEINKNIYPVYARLYTLVFNGFFYSADLGSLDSAEMINTLFELYENENADLKDAYSYMLQHGLYDVAQEKPGRFSGSFTTYIDSNNSPFLFITAEGDLTDYLTMAHEFGHFLDGYINYGLSSSLDLSEVSSQALELLTVDMLKGDVSDDIHRMLEYYELYSALNVLMIQGYYAAFEHLVYELDYDMITKENITSLTKEASKIIFGAEHYTELESVIITHTVLYPHYVESYCTSIIPSLEIFFLEGEDDGAGLDIYLDLITRDEDGERSFTEELEAVGLSSPFAKGHLRQIADDIYYRILGCHYFRDESGGNNICFDTENKLSDAA